LDCFTISLKIIVLGSNLFRLYKHHIAYSPQ
jgi:hypothetical protein